MQGYMRLVHQRQGHVPALLPILLQYAPHSPAHAQDQDGIHVLSLSDPVYNGPADWPAWFPPEQKTLTDAERTRTRSWMRAALLQRADELQEFLLERVPQLLSFESVEELRAKGLGLQKESQIDVYVLADLSDHLASGVLVDLARLSLHVCRQLGQQAGVTGLLYLPNSTAPAPAEEAIAYAALKELEYYAEGHPYNGGSEVVERLPHGYAPFDSGCYLLDDANEAGFTLRNPAQLALASCEFLYAMTFHDMASAVREQSKRRYRTATLRGKARSYESFGVAARYVPRQLLARWTEARLGGELLATVLRGESGVDAEARARTFVEQMGLEIEALESTLRKTEIATRIGQDLGTLKRTPVGQIEERARTILHTIRQEHLPVLDQEVWQASQAYQEKLKTALIDEVTASLQDQPVGGPGLQQAYLNRLRAQVNTLRTKLGTRVEQQQRELARSLGTVSETYYALRNVTMSTPPTPAVLLSVLSVLVLPILYLVFSLARQHYVAAPAALWTSLGILGIGTVGVLALVFSRLYRQRQMLGDRHIAMVRQRATLESRPAIHREIGAVYDALLEAIAQAESELSALVEQLEDAQRRFGERRAQHMRALLTLTHPGLFQSVIDEEMAEMFYTRAVPNLERTVAQLMQQAGPLPEWLARSTELGPQFGPWLDEQLAGSCALHLDKSVRRFTVTEALVHNENELDRLIQSLLESAQPLWNYDPRYLRRAVTQRMSFVGADADSPAWIDVAGPLAEACPDAIVHNTEDASTLTVLNIHRGVPLFALRRIGEYRSHYAEVLWRGRLPIHTTGKMTLAADLIPMRRLKTHPTTLFAVGLALGIVQHEYNGRYLAPRGNNQTIRLGRHKERSAALMGMDASTCREVERRLQDLLEQEGLDWLRARLDEYTVSATDLEDWEIGHIRSFCEDLPEELPQPEPQTY